MLLAVAVVRCVGQKGSAVAPKVVEYVVERADLEACWSTDAAVAGHPVACAAAACPSVPFLGLANLGPDDPSVRTPYPCLPAPFSFVELLDRLGPDQTHDDTTMGGH